MQQLRQKPQGHQVNSACPRLGPGRRIFWKQGGKGTDMSAVLLAVFNEYGVADRVRTRLVGDGFPTDRVELTASCEPGRAGLHPAASARAKFPCSISAPC